MPHIPKSRSTSKDVRAAIRYVQEMSTSVATTAANREKEAAKMRAKTYQAVKVKELLLNSITKKIAEIKKKNDNITMDMYKVVDELCKDGAMDAIVSDTINEIEEFDSKPENASKINPLGINLVKTIERDYKLYMIEFLVRAEVERMKKKRIDYSEIVSVLRVEKTGNFEARGKAMRLRIRHVVGVLYGLPEAEQRIDKLREETRTVMKNIASDIDLKEKEKQYQDSIKKVFNNSDPDTDER